MQHLDEGLLHALVDGEVPSEDLDPLTSHLAACADCRIRLDEARGLAVSAAALVDAIEVPSFNAPAARTPMSRAARRDWIRPLAFAATLVLAVGLGYSARGWRDGRDERPAFATQSAEDTAGTSEPRTGGPIPSPAGQTGRAEQRRAVQAVPERKAERGEAAPAPAPPERVSAPFPSSKTTIAPVVPPRDTLISEIGEAIRGGLRSSRTADARNPVAAAPSVRNDLEVRQETERVSLEDAIRRLGGHLRLIQGIVPARAEIRDGSVRLVYAVGPWTVFLDQRLAGDSLHVELLAPPGMPNDSVASLRARIR